MRDETDLVLALSDLYYAWEATASGVHPDMMDESEWENDILPVVERVRDILGLPDGDA